MSRKKELAFNTVIIGIGKFGTQVLSFFLLPIYTSLLSTKEYGVYDLVLTLSIFLTPIITLLMEESMFRFLIDAKSEEEKGDIISQVTKYILKRALILSITIALIGIVLKKIDIYIALLYILSNVLITSINAILRGLGRIKLFSAINFISNLFIIILNVLFVAKLRLGYLSLLYSATIVNSSVVLFIFFKLKLYKYFKTKNKKSRIKEMRKYSMPLVPNSVSWSIINTSDRLIISWFLGTSANGVYSISNKFPTVMDNIYGFFYTAWKESAAKALKDEDSSVFYNNIYDVLKNALFSIVIGMCACMPFVFNILIKNEFRGAYIYIPILILAMYYSNMSGFYGGIFSAHKNTSVMGYTTVISAIVNIIVNLICIHFIGVWAAALSTLIATFIVYIIRKRKIRSIVNLSKDSIVLRIIKVLCLVGVAYAYYCQSHLVQIITLVLVIILCIIINKKVINAIITFTKNIIKSKKISSERGNDDEKN